MSKPTLRGKPKAIAVVLWRLLHSPSTGRESANLPMKPLSPALLAILVTSAFASAQEKTTFETQESLLVPGTERTCIPHSLEVPDFVPPAPPEPKTVPAMRVDSSVTVPTKASRSLTVIRGEASTLPDLPAPPQPVPAVERKLTPEEVAQIQNRRRHNLSLGATVFDHRVSLVQWTDPDTGEFYEAVCGFDIGLLAGIGGFVHNAESYSLMLLHSNIDTSASRRILKNHIPEISDVSADSITILKGDPDNPAGIAPINAIKEIITAEKNRLIPYQDARRRYQKAAEEWAIAHPPVPRDEVIWFKPHRGSRYLKTSTQGGGR